jgi:antitoxin MazE
MDAVIQKWGNSLGVRLPKHLTVRYKLSEGSPVEIAEDGPGIKITPKKRRSLSQLLQGVTEENIHGEISTGVPRGKESW